MHFSLERDINLNFKKDISDHFFEKISFEYSVYVWNTCMKKALNCSNFYSIIIVYLELQLNK